MSADELKLKHTRKLEESLNQLRVKGCKTDIKLICKDNEVLEAHSVVLAAASNYFVRLTDTKTFLFLEYNIECLRVAVEYLYTGILQLNRTTEVILVREVMTIGQLWEVQLLITECLIHLEGSINYQELHKLAKEFNSLEVASVILKKLPSNVDTLAETGESVGFDLELPNGIAQNPELGNVCTDNQLRGILQYFQLDPNRKKMLLNFEKPIDLHDLTDDYLISTIDCDEVQNYPQLLCVLLKEKVRRLENQQNERNANAQTPVRTIIFNAFIKEWVPQLIRLGFRLAENYLNSSVDQRNHIK